MPILGHPSAAPEVVLRSLTLKREGARSLVWYHLPINPRPIAVIPNNKFLCILLQWILMGLRRLMSLFV